MTRNIKSAIVASLVAGLFVGCGAAADGPANASRPPGTGVDAGSGTGGGGGGNNGGGGGGGGGTTPDAGSSGGGGGGIVDAGPPPPPRDAGAIVTNCPDDPSACGPIFVVNMLKIGNENTGFDYTNDGRIDNRLSTLGTWDLRPFMPQTPNQRIATEIQNGNMLLLAEIRGLDDPTGQNDEDVTVVLYSARDGDCTQAQGTDGCNPADNFNGQESFCVITESLQPMTFTPRYVFPGATVRNGLLEAGPSNFGFALPIAPGTVVQLDLTQARVKARVGQNLAGLTEGVIGGVLPVNNLDKVPVPQSYIAGLSVFDAIMAMLQKTPDIDLAGDGLGTYTSSGAFIYDICCKDGVGTCTKTAPASQRINAANDEKCPQNPEVDDGYSIGLDFTAVPGAVKGIVLRGACPR